MTKILVVFGATGQQGGSVVVTVLQHPHLFRDFKIRAVTRDASKPNAQSLQAQRVELVAGDVTDPAFLTDLMEGAYAVFLLTGVAIAGVTWEEEMAEGKGVTDAAVAAGVKLLIYSTLPRTKAISGGKYTGVHHFDSKADVEDYIRAQPIKSAFFAPGSFMSNYESSLAPRPVGDGTYAFASCASPSTHLPLIDTAADTGKFVGAILADPDKYEGKTFCAATRLYSLTEMAEIMTKSSGKTIKYNQIPADVLASFMPAGRGEELVQMFFYHQDIGYYGPKSAELVAWASENALSRPTTFEEYLARVPLKLG